MATTVTTAPLRLGSVCDLLARLRPLTGFEEEFVDSAQPAANTARIANELLARCLVKPGADFVTAVSEVQALSVAERDRLLVHLRQISLGDEVETAAACPACRTVSLIRVRLSELPLRFDPPPAEVAVDFDDFGTAVIRTPSALDQEQLADLEGSQAERRSALLALLLVRLGSRCGPFSLADVRALPARVRGCIQDALCDALPDLDLSLNVPCTGCGVGFQSPFELRSFFLPSCASARAVC